MSGGMTLVAVSLGPVGSGVEPACLCTSCICLITWGSSEFEGYVSTLDSWSCFLSLSVDCLLIGGPHCSADICQCYRQYYYHVECA